MVFCETLLTMSRHHMESAGCVAYWHSHVITGVT